MEKKRYTPMEEEEGMGVCCEPIAELAAPVSRAVNGVTEVHDWIDDLDWSRFPSMGPFSEEEAIARIDEAEKDLDDPTKWVTSEQMWDRLYSKYPWLK